MKVFPNSAGLYPDGLDKRISARYHLRFLQQVQDQNGDEWEILMEFYKNYPLHFYLSDWVCTAAGRIVLGLPFVTRERQKSARRFFNSYWGSVRSPKQAKHLKILSECIWYFPSRQRWVNAVKWFRKQANWPLVNPRNLAREFNKKHPDENAYLQASQLESLCETTMRSENISPSNVVLAFIAKLIGVSPKTLSKHLSASRSIDRE